MPRAAEHSILATCSSNSATARFMPMASMTAGAAHGSERARDFGGNTSMVAQ